MATTDDGTLTGLHAREIGYDAPGQPTFLDRLLDLLTIDTMRAWYKQTDVVAPPWRKAHRDPIVGHNVRLMHDSPERPWTIAALASTIGVSRANLAVVSLTLWESHPSATSPAGDSPSPQTYSAIRTSPLQPSHAKSAAPAHSHSARHTNDNSG